MVSNNYYECTRILDNTRYFKLAVKDLLGAGVDAIVNPANSGLSHGAGLAATISQEAGPDLDAQCERILRKIGKVPVTMAVPTSGCDLPFKGIIHAVSPRMGDGNEFHKLKKTIVNCLIVADRKKWRSVAFPALATGIFLIPKGLCAKAFKEAIPEFWKQHPHSSVMTIWLCVTLEDYFLFKDSIFADNKLDSESI